jgi:hypothetical protein
MTASGPLFDRYLMVDWSARSKRATGPDSVWVADGSMASGDRALSVSTSKPATRTEAVHDIRSRLLDAVDARQRVLVGFDFAFGYPAGFAKRLALGSPSWRGIWGLLASEIQDDASNLNNRFCVAADLNRRCGLHAGPFWGHDGKDYGPLLNRLSPQPWTSELGRLRQTEAALGAGVQEVWKLWGNGSVGSQALLGVPQVARLRWDDDLKAYGHVWPFETGFSSRQVEEAGPHILYVEIWPGILGGVDAAACCKDEAQVTAMVRWAAELDGGGRLAYFLQGPDQMSPAVQRTCVEEEGWILGAGTNCEILRPRPRRSVLKEALKAPKPVLPKPALQLARRLGDETFRGPRSATFSLLDYWRWASSELLGNTERGRLAEFIVAKAVGATAEVRREWDAYDVVTPDGITIEVKSAAYAQAWAQARPSSIVFGIGPARAWDSAIGRYGAIRKRHAAVYVFALLGAADDPEPDPLDLSQWAFFVLSAASLDQYAPNQRSLGLSGLRALGPAEVDFDGLADAIRPRPSHTSSERPRWRAHESQCGEARVLGTD